MMYLIDTSPTPGYENVIIVIVPLKVPLTIQELTFENVTVSVFSIEVCRA